jgi:hypothetical protein
VLFFKNIMNTGERLLIMGACFLSAAIGGYTGVKVTEKNMSPQETLRERVDLNNDGARDIVLVDKKGHKYPLYGAGLDGASEYFDSGDFMKISNHRGIDYDAIEARLNSEE